MIAVAAVAWAALCGWLDLHTRRLPNALTLGAAGVGALVLLLRGETLLHQASPGSALLAFGLALVLTLPGYALGRLGAGDVKLLAAMALLGGLTALLWAFVVGAFAAVIVFAGWSLFWRIQFMPSVYRWVSRAGGPVPDPRTVRIPFAPGLALGFALSLPLASRLAAG
ncbi:prepilin peptidase; typeII/IV secretion [Thioalkalivibrio nitratireducens DSM 14787]|uniref:Prepilin peptidase typeII/IV secretion n=1 Tax=Thioalkalivibrio nitratireducens (strain DSM 14787 / UNIQEM 213 / ALEN2) TaxID=1255043 RepID=L0DYL9_THIND|nr:prepilin peptidase [Thioalkalivibrio nitratireducens]AGA34148.1 prepilin peptidase; typeII/IV secretion [Thioalkalivibrio nitratireducens DSM 14787]